MAEGFSLSTLAVSLFIASADQFPNQLTLALLSMPALTEPVCIVDGAHGVYVPQVWAQRYGEQVVESANVSAEDYAIILSGPDHTDYWEAWEAVLNDYNHKVDGVSHYLTQDSDLFEYPEGYEWEEV